MEGLPRKEKVVSRSETWVERTEKPISKDFFRLQYDFALTLASQDGISRARSLKRFAPFVFKNLFTLDTDAGTWKKLPGVSLDSALDTAYENYLKKVDTEPIPYNEGTRFGCSSYTYDEDKKAAWVHFVNAEYDETGPLDRSKISLRKQEVADVVRSLKERYPDVETINGNSWLYSLEAYRRIYPEEYTRTLTPDLRKVVWQQGTRMWGQFLTSEGTVKTELADVLLSRAKTLPRDAFLFTLLTDPLTPPLRVSAPAPVFYREYGV